MKRSTEEPGAPWLAEIRKLQSTLRELEGPFPGLAGLLSPGDEVLGLLADSPEDLPLVAFSPFAALPGSPAPMAAAGLTGAAAARAGRAPEPPQPSAVAPRPPLAPTPLPKGVAVEQASEAPVARRPAATAAEAAREHFQAPPAPAPVFSLRPRGPAAPPVPRSGPRASLPLEETSAERHPGEGATVQRREQKDVGMPPVLPPQCRDAPWGVSEAAMSLQIPDQVHGHPMASDRAGATSRPIRHLDPRTVLAAAETPHGASLHWGAPAVEPEDPWTVACRRPPASAAVVPMSGEERPGEIPAAASSFPSPFAGETLADLVNEALIEQARLHGVDLS